MIFIVCQYDQELEEWFPGDIFLGSSSICDTEDWSSGGISLSLSSSTEEASECIN
jgi:hypothetical protein